MDAFKVKVGGEVLDYRLGGELDLEAVRIYFAKEYAVEKIWRGGRYVFGILEKERRRLFLKLATTEGISLLAKVEAGWNERVYKLSQRASTDFLFPVNYASGYYQEKLFYLVTDFWEGELLSRRPDEQAVSPVLRDNLGRVIDLAEYIQQLPVKGLQREGYIEADDYREWFVKKAAAWYRGIPEQVRKDYDVERLMRMVEQGAEKLEKKTRHGDFVPWHMMLFENGRLGLFDGEHAMSDGVEYYDMCYFIHRVFSVLEQPEFAKEILAALVARGYDIEKLRVVLAARGIGGFLDRYLTNDSKFDIDDDFAEWVLGL